MCPIKEMTKVHQ